MVGSKVALDTAVLDIAAFPPCFVAQAGLLKFPILLLPLPLGWDDSHILSTSGLDLCVMCTHVSVSAHVCIGVWRPYLTCLPQSLAFSLFET